MGTGVALEGHQRDEAARGETNIQRLRGVHGYHPLQAGIGVVLSMLQLTKSQYSTNHIHCIKPSPHETCLE